MTTVPHTLGYQSPFEGFTEDNPLLFKKQSSRQIAQNYNYQPVLDQDHFKVYNDPETSVVDGGLLKDTTVYNNRFEKYLDNIKVILFLTGNGITVLKQYEEVEADHNELILFVEKNDKHNLFGSVLRMKAGSSVTANKNLPLTDIFTFAQQKQANISNKDLKRLIEKGLYKNKTTLLGWVINMFAKGLDEVFTFFEKTVEGIGDIFGNDFANALLSLKIEENHWNPEAENYNPLFLSESYKEQLNTALGKDNLKKIENIVSAYLQPFSDKLDGIENFFTSQLKAAERYFPKIVFKKLQNVINFIFKQLEQLKDFLKDPLTGLQRFIFKFAEAANALICGLINSIIDFVAGIFQLIGFLFKGLAAITDLASNASYYGTLFAETLENIIETLRRTEWLNFFKKTIVFQVQTTAKLYNYIQKSAENINLAELAYYYGYFIGLVIQTAVEILFTAGTATVAKWGAKISQLAGKALTKITTFVKQAIEKSKILLEKVLDFIDLILSQLKKGAKNLFDELSKILDEVFAGGKKIDDLPNNAVEERVFAKRETRELAKETEKLARRLKRHLQLLDKMADEALLWTSKRRPKACAFLEGKGKTVYNYSFKQKLPAGVFPKDLHPLVDDWVKDMWKKQQHLLPNHHGKCAEVLNISDWLKQIDPKGKMTMGQAREAFEGVISHAKEIGSNTKIGSKHADYKKACDSCDPLLKHFNIKEYKN